MKQLLTATLSCLLVALLLQLDPVMHQMDDLAHGSIHRIAASHGTHSFSQPPREVVFTNSGPSYQYDSLVFVGDVLLARNVEMLMRRHGDAYPFAGLDLLGASKAPAVIANFESSIPPVHKPTPAFSLQFSSPSSTVEALAAAGFTHLSIANNHTRDYGAVGLLSTIETIATSTIVPFGAAKDVEYDHISIVSTAYGNVALVGLDDTTSPLTDESVKRVLAQANQVSDLQVVYIHWGIEYDTVASERQRELAAQLVASGADVIIGHHPHVVQDIEMVDGVPVFYSLGNYIFDQYFSQEVQQGVVAVLEFKPDIRISLLPVESMTTQSQPQPLTGDAYASFLYELAQRSDKQLEEFIKRGYIPLSDTFTAGSKVAMIRGSYD